MTDALEQVFTEGLLFQVYQYPDPYDRLRHQSFQALAHEEEQNKLYYTTLAQKARLMRAYFKREGADWQKARAALVKELGTQKASTVNRWLVLARDFSEVLLQHVAAIGLRDLPQKFVVGNRFLVGKGEEARFRLSDEWGKVAFQWYKERRESGDSITAETFMQDFCTPAKHGESWARAQEKTFGVVATGFRAYTRAVEKLQTETGRRNILMWVRSAELKQKPHFALDELAALVAEMQRTKAGTNKSDGTAGSTAMIANEGAGSAAPGAGSAAPAPDDAVEVDLFLAQDQGGESEDPVQAKAMALAEADMATISIHSESGRWAEEVASSVYQTSKPIVYIECPTSRVQVHGDKPEVQWQTASSGLPFDVSCLVPPGSNTSHVLESQPRRAPWTNWFREGSLSGRPSHSAQ